jgi:hypothetical protein
MHNSTLIVAFGHRAHSGKDTCVSHLIETYKDQYDVRRYAFADELKVEVYDALGNWRDVVWNDGRLNYLELPHPRQNGPVTREQKIQWISAHKVEPPLARLLQFWGAEYRRKQDQHHWVKALDYQLKRDRPQIALISDLRFKNEFAFVCAHGTGSSFNGKGYTVKVSRLGFQLNDGRDPHHSSEVDLDSVKFHCEISVADGGEEQIAELKKDAVFVFDEILKAYQPPMPEVFHNV